MQKVNFKKLSLLGLVLMGASAVTAAILPATNDDDQQLYSISASTAAADDDSTESCSPTQNIGDDDLRCEDRDATGVDSASSSDGVEGLTSNGTTLVP